MSLPSGEAIPIEERSEGEVKKFAGVVTATDSARAVNPAFDVTPNDLVAGIITEKGVIHLNNAARRKSRLMKKLNEARKLAATETEQKEAG